MVLQENTEDLLVCEPTQLQLETGGCDPYMAYYHSCVMLDSMYVYLLIIKENKKVFWTS